MKDDDAEPSTSSHHVSAATETAAMGTDMPLEQEAMVKLLLF